MMHTDQLKVSSYAVCILISYAAHIWGGKVIISHDTGF